MFPTMMGTVVIAGLVGYISERSGFTRIGKLQAISVCVGGSLLFYFIRLMFGFGFSSPGLNAIVASVGSLVILPFHRRK